MEIRKIKEEVTNPDISTLIKVINTNAEALSEMADEINKIVEAINKLNDNQLFSSIFG